MEVAEAAEAGGPGILLSAHSRDTPSFRTSIDYTKRSNLCSGQQHSTWRNAQQEQLD